MRRRLLRIVLGVALVAALPGSVVRGSEGRILGTVVDSEGRPIDGVLVSIRGVRIAIEKSAFTDKKGRFSITLSDAAREYEINLTKDGYVTLQVPLAPKVGGLLRQTWSLTQGADSAVDGAQALIEAESLAEAAAIYNEGADAFRRGDTDFALERFAKSSSLDPELMPPLIGMARIHVAQGDFENALSKVELLLALAPSDLVGLRIRYDALAALERWSEANEVLDLLVTVDPTPGTARRVFNRGVEAVRISDLPSAAARFEQAVELDASLTPALLALSQIYLTLHEPLRAIEYAEAVVQQDPRSTEALSVLYQAHLSLDNEAGAQLAFADLKAIDPAAVSKAFYKQGVAQFDAGDVESAKKTLERVLETDPEHAKAHYSLALCYLNLGENDRAREFFRRFIELAPEDPDIGSAREMLSYLE